MSALTFAATLVGGALAGFGIGNMTAAADFDRRIAILERQRAVNAKKWAAARERGALRDAKGANPLVGAGVGAITGFMTAGPAGALAGAGTGYLGQA